MGHGGGFQRRDRRSVVSTRAMSSLGRRFHSLESPTAWSMQVGLTPRRRGGRAGWAGRGRGGCPAHPRPARPCQWSFGMPLEGMCRRGAVRQCDVGARQRVLGANPAAAPTQGVPTRAWSRSSSRTPAGPSVSRRSSRRRRPPWPTVATRSGVRAQGGLGGAAGDLLVEGQDFRE